MLYNPPEVKEYKWLLVRGKEKTDHAIIKDVMVRFNSIEVNNFTVNMCIPELNDMLSR